MMIFFETNQLNISKIHKTIISYIETKLHQFSRLVLIVKTTKFYSALYLAKKQCILRSFSNLIKIHFRIYMTVGILYIL